MVAENDAFLLKYIVAKLKKEGFRVEQAVDGEEALQKMKLFRPDLVLSDLIMPKKNGFEVLEEMRLEGKSKKTPVIILSNLGQQSDIDKGKKLGAVDYLIKADFSLKEIIEKVKEHLAKK